MKNNFEELHQMVKLDRKNSAWSKERTLHEKAQELEKEVKELIEAIGKEDDENIKEELGDVFWDLLITIVAAEEIHNIDSNKIFESITTKIKRRKPWIFEDNNITAEEEVRRWKEIKQIEKVEKANGRTQC